MERIVIRKDELKEWAEKYMDVHTDWTGTRVETKNPCLSIDEFVELLFKNI